MCGVIGYVGRRDARTRLVRGLERLEYRGYDSAGICLLTSGDFEVTKSVGKLENLKRKAAGRAGGLTTETRRPDRSRCLRTDSTN